MKITREYGVMLKTLLVIIFAIIFNLNCARFKVDKLKETSVSSIALEINGANFPKQKFLTYELPEKIAFIEDTLIFSEPSNQVIKLFKKDKLVLIIKGFLQVTPKLKVDAQVTKSKIKEVFYQELQIPGSIISGNNEDFYVISYTPPKSTENHSTKLISEKTGYYKILHFDLKGNLLEIIGRNGRGELPFDKILWLDIDTNDILWVLYRNEGHIKLENFAEKSKKRFSLNSTDCINFLFKDILTEKNLTLHCEYMYPFSSGEKVLLIGKVYTNQKQGKNIIKIFDYRKFAYLNLSEYKPHIIINKLNDPEDLPYLPYGDDSILIWQNVSDIKLKLAIYNLDGDLLNNLQITYSRSRANWRSTFVKLDKSILSVNIYQDKLNLIQWK